MWDNAERADALFGAEDMVGVRGRHRAYNGKLEPPSPSSQPVRIGEDDLELFVPARPRDRDVMGRELDLLVDTVADPALRLLLQRVRGARRRWGGSSAPSRRQAEPPRLPGRAAGALALGGQGGDALCAHYQQQGARVDRDLLLTGALLHDVGKVREPTAGRSHHYTDEGSCGAHPHRAQWSRARPSRFPGIGEHRLLHLQHLIASHQGRPEWASPKVPQRWKR